MKLNVSKIRETIDEVETLMSKLNTAKMKLTDLGFKIELDTSDASCSLVIDKVYADELPQNEVEFENLILDNEPIKKIHNKIKNLKQEERELFFNYVEIFVYGVQSGLVD